MNSRPPKQRKAHRAEFDVQSRGELSRLHSLWIGRKQPVSSSRQVLTWTRDTLRCDFIQGSGRAALASLLVRRGSAPILLWHSAKRFGDVPKAWRSAGAPEALSVGVREGQFGAVRVEHLWFELAKAHAHVRAQIEILRDEPQPFGLEHWWRLVLPGFASDDFQRGLPSSIGLFASDGGSVELHLRNLASVDADSGWGGLPGAFVASEATRSHPSVDTSRNDRRRANLGKAESTAATNGSRLDSDWIFSGNANEMLKVEFAGAYLQSWFDSLRMASGYLGEFNGRNFNLSTANWPQQVLANAPWPANDQSRSILPLALIRAALVMLGSEIEGLGLASFNGDLDTAVAAIAEPARRLSWQGFIQRCAQANLRAVLDDYALNNPASRLARIGGTPTFLDFLAAIDAIVQDFGASPAQVRQNLQARLAMAWLSHLLPQVSAAPDLPSSRTRGNAIVYYSAAKRDITIELRVAELDLTLNIDLFDWEHAIDFGRRPVLRPFVHTEASRLRAIGQAIPAFASLADIRFGYQTGVDLARVTLGLDIDIQPELTVGSFLGALLCPPCIAALFAAGSASAEITDTTWPVLVAASQPELGLDPPALRAFVGEPSFGDIDVSVALFSLNPAIVLAVDVIANIIADDVVEGLLRSLGRTVQPMADRFVQALALPAVRDIATTANANPSSMPAYTLRSRDLGPDYLVEMAELGQGPGGGPLIYPPQGVDAEFEVAVLMSQSFLSRALYVPSSPLAPLQTLKANGSLGDIDWWSEAPDLTGMPPRPMVTQQQPPPILLVPGNVGQSYWAYTALISVAGVSRSWRQLTNASPLEPIGDLVVEVLVRVESTRFEIIMFEDCEDITRLATGLMPGGPLQGAVRPIAGRPPEGGWIARRASRVPPRGDGVGPGGPEGLDYGFFVPEDTPWPDDPGPAQVPGVMQCRTVVTVDVAERELWLDARLRMSFPIRIGWEQTFAWPKIPDSGINFLPTFDFQFVDRDFAESDLDFNLVASPPLETIGLADNRRWLRALMLDRARAALRRGDRLDPLPPGPSRLHHRYGDELLATPLAPEQLRTSLEYEIFRLNTFAGALQSRNLAIEIALRDPLRGRL